MILTICDGDVHDDGKNRYDDDDSGDVDDGIDARKSRKGKKTDCCGDKSLFQYDGG